MRRETLTGSRIRERRLINGQKQADLARKAGISASYLNLIEHNRRRIGGKLLLDIASALGVEPMSLSEGAEAALLGALREVAAMHPVEQSELERVEEFAGRFPGWASLIETLAQRQSSLEQTVVSLTDRMTHDPQLAEALHDMLGAVTAIRSTSSILVETDKLEPEWQDRFHRNLNEDATRLTEGSQALVAYLNDETSEHQQVTTPQDEIEAFFQRHGYHFALLENGGSETQAHDAIESMLESADDLLVSASARAQLKRLLIRYWSDAQAFGFDVMLDEVSNVGLEPALIAAKYNLDIRLVMRRFASVPGDVLRPLLQNSPYDIAEAGIGLAVCDSSGTLTMRKPLPRFALPRFGAACPLWSLYQALSRPLVALRERSQLSGRDGAPFETLAFAAPVSAPKFGAVPLLEAHMLMIPLSASGAAQNMEPLRPIGISCRICPRGECIGRREPSILAGGV
ncbi:short-chain fatty acyl-CoA regulator family protein [Planktotalea sp.]|uniref:short-chain fatty acyl-CoA regulator family protein n=1 Tax=Planktotalea sp. TaxID=2029877 RepID=UPI0035C87AE6